jgi:hypothetical protein
MAQDVHFEDDSNLLQSSRIAMKTATEKKCSPPTSSIDGGSYRQVSKWIKPCKLYMYPLQILNNWVVRVLQFGSVLRVQDKMVPKVYLHLGAPCSYFSSIASGEMILSSKT